MILTFWRTRLNDDAHATKRNSQQTRQLKRHTAKKKAKERKREREQETGAKKKSIMKLLQAINLNRRSKIHKANVNNEKWRQNAKAHKSKWKTKALFVKQFVAFFLGSDFIFSLLFLPEEVDV